MTLVEHGVGAQDLFASSGRPEFAVVLVSKRRQPMLPASSDLRL